jgi:ferric-dicitrate binding protein FerR (iron transport regulator)
MTETNNSGGERHEEHEDAMAQMLRLAGVRPDVAPERTARVREAVYAAWQENRRRAVRRKIVAAAIGLAAAALIVIAIRSTPEQAPVRVAVPKTVATSERIVGSPRVIHDGAPRSGGVVSAGHQIRSSDIIVTDASSAAGLRTTDGTSVRLDAGSRVRWLSARSIDLLRGRVYIATATAASGFEVRTPFGTVHDRGTRFEVQLEEHALRLRIRDGLVELKSPNQTVIAPAGKETIVTASGVETKALPSYGAEWAWMDRLQPTLDIDGRTLGDFLERLAAEQGWSLRYASRELQRAASTVTLHGSVEGLSAEEALGVAMSTTGYRYRLREGALVVFRSADTR